MDFHALRLRLIQTPSPEELYATLRKEHKSLDSVFQFPTISLTVKQVVHCYYTRENSTGHYRTTTPRSLFVPCSLRRSIVNKILHQESGEWIGEHFSVMSDTFKHYREYSIEGKNFKLKDFVYFHNKPLPYVGQITDFFEDDWGHKQVKTKWLLRTHEIDSHIPLPLPPLPNELFWVENSEEESQSVQSIVLTDGLCVEFQFEQYVIRSPVGENLGQRPADHVVRFDLDLHSSTLKPLIKPKRSLLAAHCKRCRLGTQCMVDRCAQLQILRNLEHAVKCDSALCTVSDCAKSKKFISQSLVCHGCHVCKNCELFERVVAFHEEDCFRSQCTFPLCRFNAKTKSSRSLLKGKVLNSRVRIGPEFQVVDVPLVHVNKPGEEVSDETVWSALNLQSWKRQHKEILFHASQILPFKMYADRGDIMWVCLVRPCDPTSWVVRPFDASPSSMEFVAPTQNFCSIPDATERSLLLWQQKSKFSSPDFLPRSFEEEMLRNPRRELWLPCLLDLYCVKDPNRQRKYDKIWAKYSSNSAQALLLCEFLHFSVGFPQNSGVAKSANAACISCSSKQKLTACAQYIRCKVILCSTCQVNADSDEAKFKNPDFENHQRWFCSACFAKRESVSKARFQPADLASLDMGQVFRLHDQGDISAEEALSQIRLVVSRNAKRARQILGE